MAAIDEYTYKVDRNIKVEVGMVIWAFCAGFPWFPAYVVDREAYLEKNPLDQGETLTPAAENNRTVVFFDKDRLCGCHVLDQVVDFTTNLFLLAPNQERPPDDVKEAFLEALEWMRKNGTDAQKDRIFSQLPSKDAIEEFVSKGIFETPKRGGMIRPASAGGGSSRARKQTKSKRKPKDEPVEKPSGRPDDPEVTKRATKLAKGVKKKRSRPRDSDAEPGVARGATVPTSRNRETSTSPIRQSIPRRSDTPASSEKKQKNRRPNDRTGISSREKDIPLKSRKRSSESRDARSPMPGPSTKRMRPSDSKGTRKKGDNPEEIPKVSEGRSVPKRRSSDEGSSRHSRRDDAIMEDRPELDDDDVPMQSDVESEPEPGIVEQISAIDQHLAKGNPDGDGGTRSLTVDVDVDEPSSSLGGKEGPVDSKFSEFRNKLLNYNDSINEAAMYRKVYLAKLEVADAKRKEAVKYFHSMKSEKLTQEELKTTLLPAEVEQFADLIVDRMPNLCKELKTLVAHWNSIIRGEAPKASEEAVAINTSTENQHESEQADTAVVRMEMDTDKPPAASRPVSSDPIRVEEIAIPRSQPMSDTRLVEKPTQARAEEHRTESKDTARRLSDESKHSSANSNGKSPNKVSLRSVDARLLKSTPARTEGNPIESKDTARRLSDESKHSSCNSNGKSPNMVSLRSVDARLLDMSTQARTEGHPSESKDTARRLSDESKHSSGNSIGKSPNKVSLRSVPPPARRSAKSEDKPETIIEKRAVGEGKPSRFGPKITEAKDLPSQQGVLPNSATPLKAGSSSNRTSRVMNFKLDDLERSLLRFFIPNDRDLIDLVVDEVKKRANEDKIKIYEMSVKVIKHLKNHKDQSIGLLRKTESAAFFFVED